ncbi:hypothetical protein CES85_5820 [Ochrobactrum quorumnocens]|uniref:Uncharacterized protein n=1 Tax=Ochrobactrum quorumnocens TaxID=271865 RepID=A0A248UEB5_9HYPH|nr:hypothetical protein CES85_5820 [[Ochrobactrum] quorumnocens]
MTEIRFPKVLIQGHLDSSRDYNSVARGSCFNEKELLRMIEIT